MAVRLVSFCHITAILFLLSFTPHTSDAQTETGEQTTEKTVPSDTTDETYRHRSRLLYSSTAHPVQRGSVVLSGVYVVIPDVAVGITPTFSVEAGIPLMGEFGEAFRVKPKLTLWSQGAWAFAVDTQTIVVVRNGHWALGSSPRVIGTVGTSALSATLGVGVQLSTLEFGAERQLYRDQAVPHLLAGGQVRLTSWLRGLSEVTLYVNDLQTALIGTTVGTTVLEQRDTFVEFLGGVRMHSDRFAFDLGADVNTRDSILFEDRTDVDLYLRLSYRF